MIQWTRLRSGLWHGVRNGSVIAIVERMSCPGRRRRPYRLTIRHLGLTSWHAEAPEARREAEAELD